LLLRDPGERYRSGLRHEIRTLKRELGRGRGDYLRLMIAPDALQRSLYATQLATVLPQLRLLAGAGSPVRALR
jgi:hypothetical protein